MNEELSALMDGELDDAATQRLLALTSQDAAIYETWRDYHLIGDYLRGECGHRNGLHQRITDQLAKEPTVLSPRRRRAALHWARPGFAVAASVVVISAVVWVMQHAGVGDELHADHGTKQPRTLVAAQPAETQQQLVMLSPRTLNGYLLAHEEFSSSPGSYSMVGLQRVAGEGQ